MTDQRAEVGRLSAVAIKLAKEGRFHKAMIAVDALLSLVSISQCEAEIAVLKLRLTLVQREIAAQQQA